MIVKAKNNMREPRYDVGMKRFVKFCFVGACNTAVTFCMYYLLYGIVGINYILSSFIGYTAGLANSFALNRHWTFRSGDRKAAAQFMRFALVNIVSLGANLLILFICAEWLGMNKLVSQLLATGFTTIINYIGSAVVVFRVKESSA